MRRTIFLLAATLAAPVVLVLGAAPAGAQQLVDAGGEEGAGGIAFVLLAIMVFLIGFALFFMDRVRRRPGEDDQER